MLAEREAIVAKAVFVKMATTHRDRDDGWHGSLATPM
jgi:hypothetical protein